MIFQYAKSALNCHLIFHNRRHLPFRTLYAWRVSQAYRQRMGRTGKENTTSGKTLNYWILCLSSLLYGQTLRRVKKKEIINSIRRIKNHQHSICSIVPKIESHRNYANKIFYVGFFPLNFVWYPINREVKRTVEI